MTLGPSENNYDSVRIRDNIWGHHLDIARTVRYYNLLLTRYQRINVTIRTFLGLAAVIGILVALGTEGLGSFVGLAGALVAIGVVLEWYTKPTEYIVIIHSMVKDFDKIGHKYRSLWEKVHSGMVSGNDAYDTSEKILEEEIGVIERDAFGTKKGINKRSTKEAYKVEGARYAT